MGNNCCYVKNYIDEDEEYRYPKKNLYYKNTNLQLKTIYEDDENEKKSIDNCIIELDTNETNNIEKYEIADKPNSYDVVSISNDTIIYDSDNSVEIV